ncbi:hypothetical protein WJX81_003915 [Elliptochloris bilobata]|uniref:Uncharacterized protein n=1 Tax=Elliptochloris bilobata TaxID=381761 RepID=A0AAW1S3M1_9CHLO
MAPASNARNTLGLAVLGGLLSSSCCVLQLFLNALSFGCAGFSLLTPYRPLFLALTAGSFGLAHWRNRNARQTLFALAVSASLALTPELGFLPER